MRTQGTDEVGASATEYGLLAVVIAAILVVVMFALGDVVVGLFSESCDSVKSGASTTASCD